MRSGRLVSFALIGILTGPRGTGQDQPPVFGASADLVVIDLIATDASGRLVNDLRPEEVEVYEGGKRQRLEMLRLVTRGAEGAALVGSGPGVPGETAPPPGAALQGAPQAAERESLGLVVVVDLATMPFDVLARTRDAVLAMVRGEELDPATRLMLVVLDRGLQVREPFTRDRGRFAAAVEALRPGAGDGEASFIQLMDDVERTCDGTLGGVQNAITLGRAWVEDAKIGMRAALDGMGALARYLASLPGRKHVTFYSAGYAMEPQGLAADVIGGLCAAGASARGALDQAKPDSAGMLHALLDEANRAQVSVYTVDARGLMGDVLPARARAPTRFVAGGAAQAVMRRSVRAPQEILSSIADGTGATASLNTNELARGLRAAAADARGYYLLAYTPPPGRRQGRFYPVEVKVTRDGVRLRYRRGYEWLSDAARAERALSAALSFPALYAEDGLSLDPRVEGERLAVAVILPTRVLAFREQGGLQRNELLLRGLLRDDKGRPVGQGYLFAKTIEMKLPEERYADLKSRDNVEIAIDAKAPKAGRYQLAVVARHSGSRLSAASAELLVP